MVIVVPGNNILAKGAHDMLVIFSFDAVAAMGLLLAKTNLLVEKQIA